MPKPRYLMLEGRVPAQEDLLPPDEEAGCFGTVDRLYYPEKTGILGFGSKGIVYRACDDVGRCGYVAKIEPLQGELDYKRWYVETVVTMHASKSGVAPRFLESGLCMTDGDRVRNGFFISERYDGSLEGEAVAAPAAERMLVLIARMHEAGIYHQDLHLGNFVQRDGGRDIRVIDFGMSIYFPEGVPARLRAHDCVSWLDSLEGKNRSQVEEKVKARYKGDYEWARAHGQDSSAYLDLIAACAPAYLRRIYGERLLEGLVLK